MSTLDTPPMAAATSLFIGALILLSLHPTAEAVIGVCYGRKGDNLPCAQDVVDLYELYGIGAMRLYEPDQATQQALQQTDIKLMLGVRNEDIQGIASNQLTSDDWVNTNVVPYAKSINYIAVGNEIQPSSYEANSMERALQNIQNSLNSCNLGKHIKVSTAIDTGLIQNSFPPSHSEFKNLTYITPIINFLTNNDSPLLVNINPYLAYVNDPKNITLDFVLFTSCGTVFTDDKTGKEYQNLFDALYDSAYVAVKKVVTSSQSQQNGFKNPVNSENSYSSKGKFHRNSNKINARKMMTWQRRHHAKKSECGKYSSEGGDPGTIDHAKTYYTNMIKHVKKGTPLTLGQEIETYLFAMFDENLKPGDESERNYGLFTADGEPKYGILNFCSTE